MTTLSKKDINAHTNFFQSFIRIISLSGGIVILSLGTFYVWFKWFGPGNDPSATFPSESQGNFIQPLVVDINEENSEVRWSVATVCKINEIEIQEADRTGEFGWIGGTADCSGDKTGSICLVYLHDRELVAGVAYRLQANSDQCSNGEEYVSEVVEFTLSNNSNILNKSERSDDDQTI